MLCLSIIKKQISDTSNAKIREKIIHLCFKAMARSYYPVSSSKLPTLAYMKDTIKLGAWHEVTLHSEVDVAINVEYLSHLTRKAVCTQKSCLWH